MIPWHGAYVGVRDRATLNRSYDTGGGWGRARRIGPLLLSTVIQARPGPIVDRSVSETTDGHVWYGRAVRLKFWRRDAPRLAVVIALHAWRCPCLARCTAT